MVSLTNSAARFGSVCAPSAGSRITPSISSSRSRSCGRQPQSLRGFGGASRIAINNRGAAFRRDHAVVGVFEHVHAIRDPQAERAAAAAFADHDGDQPARPAATSRASCSRSPPPARALRRRCRDRRPPCPETSRWAAGIFRPGASTASPCDNPRASAFRNCDAASVWYRGPSLARSPSRAGHPGTRSRPTIAASSPKKRSPCSSENPVNMRLM